MNTNLISARTFAAAALTLALGTSFSLQAQAPASGQPGTKLEVATPQSEAYTVGNLTGKALHASNQEQLSSLSDFLIDPKTGQVRFAVAPSGAGASGETYRIIPMEAIDASGGMDNLKLNLGRAEWDKVGTMTESELQGQITINDEHLQRLAQQFALPASAVGSGSMQLIRATQLKGRQVQAGNQAIGTIEDVVIDLHNKVAEPLFQPSSTAGLRQKYLLPFQQLQFGDQPQGAISTTLNRSDFEQLQPSYSPTGYAAMGSSQGQPVLAAASAVRQAIDRDPAVRGSVQVVPQSRIVLQGSVPNDQKKSEIEQAARQAAPGVQIENQLTVRSW